MLESVGTSVIRAELHFPAGSTATDDPLQRRSLHRLRNSFTVERTQHMHKNSVRNVIINPE